MDALYFRGIILQAESRKENEEVKLLFVSLRSQCSGGLGDSAGFLMSSTVDMCNKQHLQADLPD